MKRRTEKQQQKDFEKWAKTLEPIKPLDLLAEYGEPLPLIDFGQLENTFDAKTFNTWQEQLEHLAETAEPETLEKAALVAREILKAYPTQTNPSQKEELIRQHLLMLSEYAGE